MVGTGVGEVHELRASAARYRSWVKGNIAASIGLVIFALAASMRRAETGADWWILLAILVGTPLGALSCIAIHVRTSRVRLGDGWTEYTRWFWRRTVLRTEDDLVGLLAVYSPTATNGRATPLLLVRDRRGGPRIRLSGAHWELADLEEIARHAGVKTTSTTLNAKGYEKQAPGVMPWRERHWLLFGTGAAVVLVAAIVLGTLWWFMATDRPPFDEQPSRGVSAATVADQDSLVTSLQETMGGRWETPVVRFSSCRDDADMKGWSRLVSTSLLRRNSDVGEDEIVTPVAATDGVVSSVVRSMREHGHPVLSAGPDDLVPTDDGYLELTSVPDLDDPQPGGVDISFSRGQHVRIWLHSACEAPER